MNRNSRPMGTAQRAFTLVECLTVMAVVAILLAIGVPALHRGRRVAQRLRCQTNLRQLALAWDLYLNDEEGAFYQGVNANLDYGGWQGQMTWAQRPLNPYVGLTRQPPNEPGPAAVYHCPAERPDIPGTPLSAFGYFGTSYQTNTLLIGQDQLPTWVPFPWKALHAEINQRLRGLNRKGLCSPAQLLLMGDYGWVNQWMPNVASRTGWHGRGFSHNVAFLDGHVDYLPIRKSLYVTNRYTILPFSELHALAREIQVEE